MPKTNYVNVTNRVYCHVDNGGYTFNYDKFDKDTNPNGRGITISMEFYGYGEATITMPELNSKACERISEFFAEVAQEMKK